MSTQPRDNSKLHPKRKHLLTRRSKHCSRCEKLLIKPDLSPSKIEFKRQHVALFYVPKITVMKLPPIPLAEDTIITVKIANPVHSLMYLTFSKYAKESTSTAEIKLPLEQTFIAAKDHDEEDEDEEFKKLKTGDDPKIIAERKSNWVNINFSIKALHAASVKFSIVVGVKYSWSGEQSFSFPVHFDLGPITYWSFKSTS